VEEFQCLRFPPNEAGVLDDNNVIGMGAKAFAELFGSYNDLRADREMHLVELSQAALNLDCVTMKKEDV
jgi:hypothetical protein